MTRHRQGNKSSLLIPTREHLLYCTLWEEIVNMVMNERYIHVCTCLECADLNIVLLCCECTHLIKCSYRRLSGKRSWEGINKLKVCCVCITTVSVQYQLIWFALCLGRSCRPPYVYRSTQPHAPIPEDPSNTPHTRYIHNLSRHKGVYSPLWYRLP